jgi:polyhydroxyalkanoate synthesis regulator phasin
MPEIKETLEKAFYAGMGFISRSADAIQGVVKKLADEINLSEEEGRVFAEKLAKDTEEARKNFQVTIDNAVQKAMDAMGLAKKSDMDELKKKLDEMEKNLKKPE